MADEINSQSVPPQPPMPPAKQGASGLAIASLVMGILGIFCCGPLSIGALITGIIERNNIRAGASSQSGQGIATAGFIMGIIGVILWFIGFVVYILLIIIGTSARFGHF